MRSAASGSAPIDWLGDPHWAMPAIIVFAVWKNFGYNMIIFLAGLQSIPEDLYEAARIDGAPPGGGCWRHAAGARAGAAAGRHAHHGRLLPAVRRALRDDAGRPAAEHGERALFHVRARIQVVEPGLGLGRRLHAVRDDVRRDGAAAAHCSAGQGCA